MQSPDTLTATSGPHRQVQTVVLTSVAFFMVTLDALVVITALPAIQRDLGGDLATLQWTVNAYALAFGAGILTAAALGDRLGRRRLYSIGLAVFTVASAACALAPSSGELIAARTVQGLGAAIVTPLSLTILTSAFPMERRGAIVGIWGGVAGLAVASGPLIGGAVTQGLSWHWIFWVNVPVGVAAIAGSVLRLPESYGPRTRLDLPALVLVSGGVLGLTWGLVRASQVGWGSAEIVLSLTLGAALIAGFVAWEARTAEPMVPLRLFGNRTFSAAVGTAFLLSASLISAAFLASEFFQFGLRYSPLATGLRFLPWTATPLVVAPLAGALSDKIGSRPLMVLGLVLQGGGLLWIALMASTAADYTHFVAPFIIAGVGVSMALPATSTAALNAVTPAEIGKASGVLNTLRQFGAVFGVAVATAVFAANGSLSTPTAVSNGFKPAFTVSALLSMMGAICAVGVRRALAARQVGPATHPSPVPGAIAAPGLASD
jgi:EmrB/QacA subfamily drug resistance transporter